MAGITEQRRNGWSSNLQIRDSFPDLATIGRELYPGSVVARPTTNEYAAGLRDLGRLTPPVAESIEKGRRLRHNSRAMLYVAGALTGVDEATKARYEQINDLAAAYGPIPGENGTQLMFAYVPHLHGTDPIKHPDVTSEEVRDIDYLYARVLPDLHINSLAPVAHGNAIEEGWAEMALDPTVYLNPKGNRLSRLTKGMNNVVRTIEYDDFDKDGITHLRHFMDEYSAWLKYFPDRDAREFYFFNNLHGPILRRNGSTPEGFNPLFDVDQFVMYVNDPLHPRYGQAGELIANDWNDSGNQYVQFSDGAVDEFYFGSRQLNTWVK